jgi:hypothetical protein
VIATRFVGNGVGITNLDAVNFANQSANRFLAGPTTGAAATPTFRLIANDDLSSLSPTFDELTVSGASSFAGGSATISDSGEAVFNTLTVNNAATFNGVQTNLAAVYGTAQTNSGAIRASSFFGNGAGVTNYAGTNLVHHLITGLASATNSLALNNGYQDYNAGGNVAITNITGQEANRYKWATLVVSNSTASVITQFITSTTVRAIGTGTTNALVIGSGKIGITTFGSRGSFDTNYSNALQQ